MKEGLVEEEQEDRTPTALWPSDHAGVSAKLKLQFHHNHHHSHHKPCCDESSD